jgi:hypothetical protein
MAEPINPGPNKAAERAARELRLATALRDNLRRRKEQARAQQRLGAEHPKKDAGGDGEPPA